MTYPSISPVRDEANLQCHVARFRSYVLAQDFPCVGARSAINKGRMAFGLYAALGDPASAAKLCADLEAFSSAFETPGTDPVSFVAMFKEPTNDELSFSESLWAHLQVMHEIDRLNHDWDRSVSADPASKAFSFSIGGRAFFVVGLSPGASRLSRRAPFPCLVFNFHEQFESLKQSGKYAGMQKATQNRDIALQGFMNPTLARFGDASEARQYAGNAVADDWVCPFAPRATARAG